jgi:excisionase family DNA binding protein
VSDRDEPREAVDVHTTAARLGVHPQTVYELIRRGAFPVPVIRIGRRVLIQKAALDEMLGGAGDSGDTA